MATVSRKLVALASAAGLLPLLLTITLALSACRSIRPVSKVGLLAPFEGLYRRSSYDALNAVRLALAEAPPTAGDLLPLALDITLDPARAMQKLLADNAVHTVIGPLTPQSASMVQAPGAAATWYAPFAISATGEFVAFTDFDAWAKPLLLTAANAMQRQGRDRLVVAGWPAGWPEALLLDWDAEAGLPVVVSDDLTLVQGNDAVFYFGEAAEAAAYLRSLRAAYADLPFVMGPAGEDPVFVEHSQSMRAVYWVTWSDDGYAQWASRHPPGTRLAYLVYRATQAAIVDSKVALPTNGAAWTVQLMAAAKNK